VAVRQWRSRAGIEVVLAFLTGVGWFALSAVLLAVLPHSWVVVVVAIVVDVAVVLAIARSWGIGSAVSAGMASVVALDWYYIPPIHPEALPDAENAIALLAYLLTGTLLGELAATTRRRAQASERARAILADEQAALRRVATLVAREASPEEVFAAVTEEVGRLLPVDMAALWRYETDGSATVVGAWSRSGRHVPLGTRLPIAGGNMAAAVLETRGPVRIDSYDDAPGELALRMRDLGVRSSIGSPVLVDGRLWGMMAGASLAAVPIAPGTENRLVDFTELAGTAVANAESRAELTSSRARIVSSGDQARRRIERDLHDGIQQRLVALALDARGAEGLAGPGQTDLAARIAAVREGLVGAVDELREVAHGIHPAILSEGGLRPALAKLARRSPVPVELHVDGPPRLPEPVEVCVYYVVSEALTNVAKHARATVVEVDLEADDGAARLTIHDDGVGGVDVRHGSGVTGIRDRVHALGGAVDVTSVVGEGTSIRVRLPVADSGSEPATRP
jgi:signal transduction histidine kinase